MSDRAAKINRRDRLTDSAIQDVLTAIIDDQSVAADVRPMAAIASVPAVAQELLSQVLTLVHDHHEEI